MFKKGALFVLSFVLLLAADAPRILARDAIKNIGRTKQVCGKVVEVKYSPEAKGQPTYLYLDSLYPKQSCTVLIWGADRKAFQIGPDALYDGKFICASGKITLSQKKPQIVVRSPSQICFVNAHPHR